jgi:hypothetical protein
MPLQIEFINPIDGQAEALQNVALTSRNAVSVGKCLCRIEQLAASTPKSLTRTRRDSRTVSTMACASVAASLFWRNGLLSNITHSCKVADVPFTSQTQVIAFNV